MHHWTRTNAAASIFGFATCSEEQQNAILDMMNASFPFSKFEEHRMRRSNALRQMDRARSRVAESTQCFPPFVQGADLDAMAEALKGFAVVFTAGGEGERLRISLQKRGVPEAALHNFTKATFGLPGFPGNPGTLQLNLAMIATICRQTGFDIPVIVTTGPAGSTTAEVIPEILAQHKNFGLRHLAVIPQDERLFLTNDEQIVLTGEEGSTQRPVTNPDETGGPLMKLKQPGVMPSGASVLEWLDDVGCSRTIVVQATALYHQTLLPLMASALGKHDCLGVGILRSSFPPSDQYGTFVSLKNNDATVTTIIEQDVRNDDTRSITDATGAFHLPFNTGFYAFKNKLLRDNDLPDFATPPKELRPDLPRAPKIGYAAIDIITIARDPIILTIDNSLFGVLKNADDLDVLAQLGRKFGLDRLVAG
jgi:hypothetical protein